MPLTIVFLSHTARTEPFRIGSHHLSAEFAALGHRVAHVTTPVTLGHLLRLPTDGGVRRRFRLAIRPWKVSENLTEMVAVAPVPLGAGGILAKLNSFLCASLLARSLRRRRFSKPDLVLIDQPLFCYIFARLDPGCTIYRGTDVYLREETPKLSLAVLDIASQVDGVIATSETVLTSVSVSRRLPTLVLHNGVEVDRFRSEDAGAPREGAIYVGALDDRFDWPMLIAIAEANDSPVLLAGPLGAEQPKLPANVRLLGPVPYASVPALMQTAKVGLLPLSEHPQNAGRSPMKYFEYLVSGLFVVAFETPTLLTLAAPGVWLYRSRDDGVRAYREALSTASPNVAGKTAASAHSWSSNARAILEFSGNASGRARSDT
jgi:teichuronic acid biosynthesis glycosyltransferase TuaH